MKNRGLQIAGFLEQYGWDDADIEAFPGDFSSRRYARLTKPGGNAIFMDADTDQKTENFVAVAKILRQCGIASPEIYAADPMQGLVLMQDFGTGNMGVLLDQGHDAAPLYRRAVDVLVQLHRNFKPAMIEAADLPTFNTALFLSQVELFVQAYFPFVKNREVTAEELDDFRMAWSAPLNMLRHLPQSLLLRDYMPDNLMLLPGEGVASIGVLDFQDAGTGPITYDLASLCETVRRDGGDRLLLDMLSYYHQQANPAVTLRELIQTCTILAAQRHMRILGLLAQLARKGRREKLVYIPRIWNYFDQTLQQDFLTPVKEWCRSVDIKKHDGIVA